MDEPLRVFKHGDGASINCVFCRRCVEKDCTQACFIFDKELDEVIEQCTKAQRKRYLDRFLRMVNTLLNEGGGVIYIHSKPHLLGFWDEQIDNDLMELVPDDTLFDDNFERNVVIGENHVIFRVKPGHRPLSTREFHTKVSLNKGLADPTHYQMRRLMRQNRPPPDGTDLPPHHTLSLTATTSLHQGAVVQFHEDVHRQAKVVHQRKLDKVRGGSTATKLVSYWWQELKLPLYVAAFTKQGHGGSFFLGLREDKVETGPRWQPVPRTEGLAVVLGGDGAERRFWQDDKNEALIHLTSEEHVPKWEHRTGRFVCEGLRLPQTEHDHFKKELEARVRDLHVLAIGHTQRGDQSPDLDAFVDVFFYPVSPASNGYASEASPGGCCTDASSPNQLYVVEARVRYFHGVCFQNQEGPEAYEFDCRQRPREAVRVDVANWVHGQRCVTAQA